MDSEAPRPEGVSEPCGSFSMPIAVADRSLSVWKYVTRLPMVYRRVPSVSRPGLDNSRRRRWVLACRVLGRSRPNGLLAPRHRLPSENPGGSHDVTPACSRGSLLHNKTRGFSDPPNGRFVTLISNACYCMRPGQGVASQASRAPPNQTLIRGSDCYLDRFITHRRIRGHRNRGHPPCHRH